eukprot:3068900-Rhodomonas_salina.1
MSHRMKIALFFGPMHFPVVAASVCVSKRHAGIRDSAGINTHTHTHTKARAYTLQIKVQPLRIDSSSRAMCATARGAAHAGGRRLTEERAVMVHSLERARTPQLPSG